MYRDSLRRLWEETTAWAEALTSGGRCWWRPQSVTLGAREQRHGHVNLLQDALMKGVLQQRVPVKLLEPWAMQAHTILQARHSGTPNVEKFLGKIEIW